MNALQEWLDFRADLAHPPTREGFIAAWRQMTGKEPPTNAIAAFGHTVVRLFIHACDDSEASGDRPPALQTALADALKTGLLCGFNPKDYGYDITIHKLKTAPERVH